MREPLLVRDLGGGFDYVKVRFISQTAKRFDMTQCIWGTPSACSEHLLHKGSPVPFCVAHNFSIIIASYKILAAF